MKKKIIVHEGFTNNYLVLGVIGLVGSALLFFISPIFAGIGGCIGLIVISGTNGLEIAIDDMQFRKYGSFLGIKVGTWKKLTTPIFAQLFIAVENETKGGTGGLVGSVMPNGGKLSSLTYNISVDTKDQGAIILYDFLEYKTAKKALKEMETSFKIPVHDKVQEKLLLNIEKRKNRGY